MTPNERLQAVRVRRCGARGSGRFFMGGAIVLLGVLFLLQNLGVLYVDRLWQFWPVILVALGASKLLAGPGLGRRVLGGLIAGTGLILLANSLGYLQWDVWRVMWPLWLILWGVAILFRGFGRRRGSPQANAFQESGTTSTNVLDENAMFGGIHRKIESQDFEGGEVNAIFGGIEIDLRGAATKKDEIRLEINAVFGGVDLQVPDTWDVTMRGAAFLGGHEDKTHPSRPVEGVRRPRLIVEGNAVFGGVSVRN